MPYRFTLLGDGSSDVALVPVLEWVLQGMPRISRAGYSIEFTTGKDGKRDHSGLAGRMDAARRSFPCDLLFVHRDAEADPPELRLREIGEAAQILGVDEPVPVVPVRMTEAWLLIHERALRTAADNPNGTVPLGLPSVRKLESIPDPKQICNELLIRASEMTGRRKKQFNRPSDLAWRRGRLARLIEDYSPLVGLASFDRFREAAAGSCAGLA